MNECEPQCLPRCFLSFCVGWIPRDGHSTRLFFIPMPLHPVHALGLLRNWNQNLLPLLGPNHHSLSLAEPSHRHRQLKDTSWMVPTTKMFWSFPARTQRNCQEQVSLAQRDWKGLFGIQAQVLVARGTRIPTFRPGPLLWREVTMWRVAGWVSNLALMTHSAGNQPGPGGSGSASDLYYLAQHGNLSSWEEGQRPWGFWAWRCLCFL